MRPDPTLRRFWFPVPGHLGIGLSARSRTEAESMAQAAAAALGWVVALAACVEDIDVSTLDARHVLPNMSPPIHPGVWFPPGLG